MYTSASLTITAGGITLNRSAAGMLLIENMTATVSGPVIIRAIGKAWDCQPEQQLSVPELYARLASVNPTVAQLFESLVGEE